MPYKKDTQKFLPMKRLLKGYEITAERFAQIKGCSIPTARDRLEEPGKLTLYDLDLINRFGHVPIEEIRQAVTPY